MKTSVKKNTGLLWVLTAAISGFAGSWIYQNFFGNSVTQIQVAGPDSSVPSRMASAGTGLQQFESASAISTPTVVFIKTVSTVRYESPLGWFWDFDPFGSRGKASSTGSGVIVSSDGYIVTNNHVIQGADEITVVLNKDRREYKAEIVGTDPSSDLALIKINKKNLPAVVFGNSDEVNVGEWVLAVGNPFNLNSTVTAGIVSAKGRNINIVKNQFPIESFIQTDAAINPGNSGGALVNLKGHLVGINTAIQSNTGSYTGYGFAIPSNIVQKIVRDFIDKGEVLRAFTGFEVAPLSPEELQALNRNKEPLKVRSVIEGSIAEKEGIKVGDIILKIGDIEIDGRSSYDEFLAYQRPSNQAPLTILRDGKEKQIKISFIDGKTQKELLMKGVVSSNYLGADFQPLSVIDRGKFKTNGGIRILNIRRGGAIAQMGLGEGFVVLKFNGKTFEDPEDLISAMEGSSGSMKIEGVDSRGNHQSFSFFRY
jgi:serine protease Do